MRNAPMRNASDAPMRYARAISSLPRSDCRNIPTLT